MRDLLPCPESPQEEQPAQPDQDAWSVEDVQLEFFDISCMPEQREELGRKQEVSSQTGCANCLPANQAPVIDAEERALLNLLKFDNRVPRGSRWNAPGVSRRYVTLVEWPKRVEEEKDRHKYKKRARMDKTSSMLERLQSRLNRAEVQKAAAASLDSAKALEGKAKVNVVLTLGRFSIKPRKAKNQVLATKPNRYELNTRNIGDQRHSKNDQLW